MSRKTQSMQAIDQHVGHKIKWYRVQRGLSQYELAERLDISYQQLHKYENGSNSVSASRLSDICKILGITVDKIFDDIGTKNEQTDILHESNKEQLLLVKYLNRINDRKHRESLHQFINVLSQ